MSEQLALLLLVEDSDPVLEFLVEALTEAGYEVLAVVTGNKAVAELNADAARFRAVVTDIRLGDGPNGWAVARRARELVHDMPVIYISADSGHDWAAQGVPNSVLIAKPFALAQLVTAVSTLLTAVDTQRAGSGATPATS